MLTLSWGRSSFTLSCHIFEPSVSLLCSFLTPQILLQNFAFFCIWHIIRSNYYYYYYYYYYCCCYHYYYLRYLAYAQPVLSQQYNHLQEISGRLAKKKICSNVICNYLPTEKFKIIFCSFNVLIETWCSALWSNFLLQWYTQKGIRLERFRFV